VSAENTQLKKYEALGKYLEGNPQVANDLANRIRGGQSMNQVKEVEAPKPPENFDPFEAYTEPNSESYKHRIKEAAYMADRIAQSRVSQATETVGRNMAMQQLVENLKNQYGYDDAKVQEFVKFASTPANELGLEKVVQMFETTTKESAETSQENPLNTVRGAQKLPPTAGILQGVKPQPRPETDSRWAGVLNASRVGNKIP